MSQRFSHTELMAEYWKAMCQSQLALNLARRNVEDPSEYHHCINLANSEANRAGSILLFALYDHANHEEAEEHRDVRTGQIVRASYSYSPIDPETPQ